MNKLTPVLLLLLAIVFPASSFSAPRVGNGGGVWLCEERGSTGYRWMRFVDLFEAEEEFGFKLIDARGRDPWEIFSDIRREIPAVSPALESLLRRSPVRLAEILRFLPPGTGLTIIEDAMIRVRPLPSSCDNGYLYYGQLANFTFDGRLLVSSTLWNDPQFDDLQRSALLVHELIYKALRDGLADGNSSRARRIVGILYSTLTPFEKSQLIGRVLLQSP